jgi:DNA repair exonuclease SbcCD ATPase subunit
LEDHVKELNEDHRTKTEAMNEEHRKQMQEQSQQHEKTLQEELQPYIQNDKALRDQLAGLQQMLQAAHPDQDLAQQLTDANAEIERLRHLHAHPSPHSPAPDAAELERLRKENEDLQLQLSAHEAVDKSTVHSQSALAQAKKTIRQQEKLIAQLRAEITDYKAALEELRKQLEGLLRSQQQDAKDLHNTVAKAVHQQIDIAGLVAHLQNKNLAPIRAAVRRADTEQIQYSPCALFLILESFGGTWAKCVSIVENPNHSKYEARCKLIVEQLLYDLTMWDSIANEIKPTRYTSHHVAEFIKHFKLNPK